MRTLFFFALFFLFSHITYAIDVEVSEFFPNPVGDDVGKEWIELHNVSTRDLQLDEWSIADTYGTPHTFALHGLSISAGEYLVLPQTQTSITLNNDADQIKLTDSTGQTFLSGKSGAVHEGMSFANGSGVWKESLPSPGDANEVSPGPTPSPTPFPSPSPSPSDETTQPLIYLDLSEFSACSAGEEWVEIFNPNDQVVDLSKWSIGDSSGHAELLSGSIDAHAYLVKSWSQPFLNNAGDSVRLLYQNEAMDSFTYTQCTSGKTWVKKGDGGWAQTSQNTKGVQNSDSATGVVLSATSSALSSTQAAQKLPLTYVQPFSQKTLSTQQYIYAPRLSNNEEVVFIDKEKPREYYSRNTRTPVSFLLSTLLYFFGGGYFVAAAVIKSAWYNARA